MKPAAWDKDLGAERDLRPGDLAILCRKNDRAAAIAEALGRRGIAASLAGAGLLSTPEACLALACLRRLADSPTTLPPPKLSP